MSSQQQLCDRCGKGGHSTPECRWMTRACFKCGNMGHKAIECPFVRGSQPSYSQALSIGVAPPLQPSRLVVPHSRPQRPQVGQ